MRGSNRNVTVRFWGVRGSIPAPGAESARYGGNTACVELRVGDTIIILDAGSGIRQLGRELAREFGERPIDATLLISHTHWDHIQGLPFFRAAYSSANNVRIAGATGTAESLTAALCNQMAPMHFPVGLGQLVGLEAVADLSALDFAGEGIDARTIELNHPGGCTGFRFEIDGTSVAYLPDHEAYHNAALDRCELSGHVAAKQAALVAFLRNADVLILDSQYDAAEYRDRVGWGHSCVDDSVDLAIAAEVHQLVLFHHDPEHSDEWIDRLLAIARARATKARAPLKISAAAERQVLTLKAREVLAA
jgi:phosphoribosyl 1,2-cyclic phosphodiesterase